MASSATILTGERLEAYSTAADKALAQVKRLMEASEKELQEYSSLIGRLEELPRKRTEAIMCPIGSVGFLPATIVHTNEVFVGLGDGYFVDTTAYHAIGILERRKAMIRKNIVNLKEHEEVIKKQLSFAKDIFANPCNANEVEIREEYDEEKEAELRRRRRSRISKPRPVTKTVADVKAEAEMMLRLEQLELQEWRNKELVDDTFPINANTACEEFRSRDASLLSDVCIRHPTEDARFDQHVSLTASTSSQNAAFDGRGLGEVDYNCASVEADSPGVFKGEDLTRMLMEHVEEEDAQAYQPPRGVSTEDYQKLLRIVDDLVSDDSVTDRISEENGDDEEVEDTLAAKGCELDSDDLNEPQIVADVRPPLSPTMCGINAGLVALKMRPGSTPDAAATRGNEVTISRGNGSAEISEESGMESEGKQPVANQDSSGNGDNELKKKKRKKKRRKTKSKKCVAFAEQLENATLIDSNAPPSEIRNYSDSPSTSQPMKSSILVNSNVKSPVNEDLLGGAMDGPKILPGSTDAFSDVVVERNTNVCTSSSVPAASTQSSKPQSLFRMKRLRD